MKYQGKAKKFHVNSWACYCEEIEENPIVKFCVRLSIEFLVMEAEFPGVV